MKNTLSMNTSRTNTDPCRVHSSRMKMIRGFETICLNSSLFQKWYYNTFYKRLIAREIQAADLTAGGNILHVGCGPMPYTSLALARSGKKVTALDIDSESAVQARKAVASAGLSSQITVHESDGLNFDPSTFDGIWISLHVSPKDKIVPVLLSKMKPGAVLIIRNPRSWLRLFYPRTAIVQRHRKVRQGLGKMSAVLQKPGENQAISLCSLKTGDSGTISSVPDHPLLSPLGFRPGKEITITGRCIFGGPIVAHTHGRSSAIHRSLAQQVYILPNMRRSS